MNRNQEKIHDAIFIITREQSCPLYNVGEEIKVANQSISISSYKPVCLYLAEKVKNIAANQKNFAGGISPIRTQKSQFDCGGCAGSINFEYKQEKDFATLQMKLLVDAEEKRRREHLEKFYGMMRSLPIFEALENDALRDLTLLLTFKAIPLDKVVIKKGAPCTNLFIILKGQVGVIGDDGSRIMDMGPGEILGEMSFLTGDPITHSIHTLAPTQLALLSIKNFRNMVAKYPVLQLFLFKMLVDWAQAMALRSGNLTSGMTGELAEIPVVDLFQLINSSQKTGMIGLSLDQGKASVYFQDGEIVYARYLNARNREAVFAILKEDSGFFSYTKGIPKELQGRPPIGDFMGMLMEGLQRIDED